MSELSAADERSQRILAVVRAIPAGQVMAYGEVARAAGYPRGARLVARALGEVADPGLPWHRVLRADRRIAFPSGSRGFAEQRRRLRAEGLQVDAGGRVRLPERPAGEDPRADLDRALWG
ncbi:MGMT family protein [Pseudomarimonas salicorniae]|uniref:MGMT family protein n=1 Tax=Pseudomarimonas salicorniae TaxID=2933270 RepID=A0ABT0GJV0_9GAMM|nr:MGMT family protein [Lysobacter sp. CAU 1642]MCK7594312.1 MGMT family protein [Lysobacter sp. CAU 1642]